MNSFAKKIIKWHKQHGRHDLPWQMDATPYRVWVSEIMLQQTQVKTVISYFERFTEKFPNVSNLADASLDDVLHLWSGLGYYARARNLHKAARIIVDNYDGIFPEDIDTLISLPGIGRSTAGAILSLACNQRHTILDGNVKRVLSRYEGVQGWPGEKVIEQQLWTLAEKYTPKRNVSVYTQAIMDLGAGICRRGHPVCKTCPVINGCYAYTHDMQSVLPTPRKKRTLPVRETIFTIVQNDEGQVLLQRRPPAGIWGGLWSFPECPDENISGWFKKEFGSNIDSINERPPIRHTFSHFHLDIRPVQAEIKTGSMGVRDENDLCWYEPGQARALGLAAPVLKLLQEIS
jgi:A/G-specific adenine glycosylase